MTAEMSARALCVCSISLLLLFWFFSFIHMAGSVCAFHMMCGSVFALPRSDN